MIIALLLVGAAPHVTCTEVSMWRTVCVIDNHRPKPTPYWTPPVILNSDREPFQMWVPDNQIDYNRISGRTMHADCFSWETDPECPKGNWNTPCVNMSGQTEHCDTAEPKKFRMTNPPENLQYEDPCKGYHYCPPMAEILGISPEDNKISSGD
jgi:hypothetical protein